jgi:hypothetical protein
MGKMKDYKEVSRMQKRLIQAISQMDTMETSHWLTTKTQSRQAVKEQPKCTRYILAWYASGLASGMLAVALYLLLVA